MSQTRVVAESSSSKQNLKTSIELREIQHSFLFSESRFYCDLELDKVLIAEPGLPDYIPLSFGLASSQWVPEISHHCPRTPFLLVGTQVDLRDDSNTLEKLAKNKQRALACESGEKLARELKAVKYVECSALTQVRREGGRDVLPTT